MPKMDFAINILEKQKKAIDRNIKVADLMQSDMTKASREMEKVSELNRAIKYLKSKNRR